MAAKTFTIVCAFDAEVRVWYVADSDVPGLSLEASSKKAMLSRIREAVPELLELNAQLKPNEIDRAPIDLLWASNPTRHILKAS